MSIDQKERRRVFRDGIRKFVRSSREMTQAPIQTYDLIEFVAGLLIDQIADLEGRVEELERRLSDKETKG